MYAWYCCLIPQSIKIVLIFKPRWIQCFPSLDCYRRPERIETCTCLNDSQVLHDYFVFDCRKLQRPHQITDAGSTLTLHVHLTLTALVLPGCWMNVVTSANAIIYGNLNSCKQVSSMTRKCYISLCKTTIIIVYKLGTYLGSYVTAYLYFCTTNICNFKLLKTK